MVSGGLESLNNSLASLVFAKAGAALEAFEE